MGKIKQGILGGFNGTVGTVVGGSWKGIAYMRGKAQSIKNPNTQAQKDHRSKFAMVVAFLQQIKPFIDLGYKGASKQSPFNAAMSHIMKNGIVGTSPNFAIGYANILVAQGSLAGANNAAAVAANNKISLSWSDNSANGEGTAEDVAIVLFYNEDKEEAIVNTDAALREDEIFEQATPASWNGDTVHPYIAFVSANGSVSNSVHMTAVTAVSE